MASNGLLNKAKKGTCRICQRVRNTDKYLKAVGEVLHGFATGYIWECTDIEDCNKTANKKISGEIKCRTKERIENAIKAGRFTEYFIKK